jgi:hypothetical protein
VGYELKGKAVGAIFWSLVFIILYIWWRFQFTYGHRRRGGAVSTTCSLPWACFPSRSGVSLAIVAALLTIVGYSLNRHHRGVRPHPRRPQAYRRESYEAVINRSINETLSPHHHHLGHHAAGCAGAVHLWRPVDSGLQLCVLIGIFVWYLFVHIHRQPISSSTLSVARSARVLFAGTKQQRKRYGATGDRGSFFIATMVKDAHK